MTEFEQIDLHVHTCLSECAHRDMTVGSILERAAEVGYRTMALADHVYGPEHAERVQRNLDAVSGYEGPVQVFVAAEVCMVSPGKLAAPIKLLKRADFVLVAINHLNLSHVAEPSSRTPGSTAGASSAA